jgi:hypothetical protein
MTNTAVMANYEDAIANLPAEALLGSLLWFSISEADVNLDDARKELINQNLDTRTLRDNLRPIDAFRKSTREFAHKFKEINGVRSELMVRPVGEDGEFAHRHLILERTVVRAGKKRQIFYEKVGEIVFTRGVKKNGEYSGHGVEATRTTAHLSTPLTTEEDGWLSAHLNTMQARFEHYLTHLDSHAVRTYVREYIKNLSGTLVKESGSLYFVKQGHVDEVSRLGAWVHSVGSQFHSLPLLNLVEQREMIKEAFEEETIKETERLMGEVAKILSDPNRKIEEKTFDAYGLRAAELSAKVHEYNQMLGTRVDRAATEIGLLVQQVNALAGRIRESKTHTAKRIP